MATFGRYEILERLAIGGMAEVFRARAWGAGGFSKDVVIKKILPGYSSDPEFRSLFIHEARISVGLTHSRITQVLDFGLMDGSYFIAMELVDGPDLGELLATLRKEFSRMPLPAAVHVLAEVLEGLDYAHRCTAPDGKPLEIVHRDISPHNVLLSRAGEVKLTDFGIARAAGSPSVTRVGRVRGKPQYMSPEQIRGQPLDGRSDLFSCGLLFYELLTGFPAYVGTDDGVLMNAILRGELEPASARVKDVPRALDAVVERALHPDQDQRFSTASEFRQTLLDVAYAYRIRPDSEALASLVRGHFARPKESRPAVVPSLVALTGEDGGLGRFSTSANSLQIPTADTADSVRGSKSTAGTATAESERGPSVMFPESSGESTVPHLLPAAAKTMPENTLRVGVTPASAPEPPPLEPTNVLPMRSAPAPKPAVAWEAAAPAPAGRM